MLDEVAMRRALDQARAAALRGDPSFGAVVTYHDRFVGEAGSTERSNGICIAHDTMEALRQASHALGQRFLDGCTFYGSAEPCPMCSAALLQARVSRVVIGASGASLAELLGKRHVLIEDIAADYHAHPVIERGLLAQESMELLRTTMHDRGTR
jgi:tRNA(adenine34) deaminase